MLTYTYTTHKFKLKTHRTDNWRSGKEQNTAGDVVQNTAPHAILEQVPVEWGPNLDGIAGGEFSRDLLDVLGGETHHEEQNVTRRTSFVSKRSGKKHWNKYTGSLLYFLIKSVF